MEALHYLGQGELPKHEALIYGEKAISEVFKIRLFVWNYIKNTVPSDDSPSFDYALEE
jgi:hypothetical protein